MYSIMAPHNFQTHQKVTPQTYRSKRITKMTFCLRSLVPRDKY